MDSTSAPRRPPPTLVSLQVLRAAAALLVLVHHASYDADTVAAHAGVGALDVGRSFDLTFGVHLFFVVSGFIMLRTARGFGRPRAAAVFMARRIIRVVPLYWLLTSAALVVGLVAPAALNTPPVSLGVALGSYLFVPVMRAGGEVRPVLGQGWTLDYEMFFYLLFTLAMLMPRRAGLWALSAALLGLVGLGRLVPAATPILAVWTDGMLLEFLFGMAIGLAGERGVTLGPAAAAAALMVGCGAAVGLGPAGLSLDAMAPWAAQGLPAAAIVAGCALGPLWPARGPVLGAALLGDASYSLYLSHPFAVRALREVWIASVPATVPLALYLVSAIVAAVGAALLLHAWVERPMTAWLQHRSRLAGAVSRPILPGTEAAGHPGDGSATDDRGVR